MREIKFRAWHKRQQRMYYWPQLRVEGITNMNDVRDDNSLTIYQYFDQKKQECVISNNLEFLQYTGIKDKNDKDVYEGDIVEMRKFKNGQNINLGVSKKLYRRYVVKWGHGSWNVPWSLTSQNRTILGMYTHEVVGNIYENPELLDTPIDQ